MISVDLTPEREQQLRSFAQSHQQEVSDLARRVLEEFLDHQAWKPDLVEDWAEASVAMTPEILPNESWNDVETADEPR